MSFRKRPPVGRPRRNKTSQLKLAGPGWFAGLLLGLLALLGWLELRDARIDLEMRSREIEAAWRELEQDLSARGDLAAEFADAGKLAYAGVSGDERETARLSLEASLSSWRAAKDRGSMLDANLSLERALRRYLAALPETMKSPSTPERTRLQEQMLMVEHRIAQRRTAYNEAVQRFNTRLAIFPANVAASVYGFARDPHYLRTDLKPSTAVPPPPRSLDGQTGLAR